MNDRPNNRVSMGRNHSEPWCRTCPHLKPDGKGWGGWCQHPSNRVPPSSGWPTGFTPSQAFDGGCDLHPESVTNTPESPMTDLSIHAMELAKSRLQEQTARIEVLEEALRKIAAPGYGLELNDPIEVRELYWQQTLLRCRQIARAALNNKEQT